MGMDFRAVAPKELQPSQELVDLCLEIAKETGFKENTVRCHARKHKVRLSNSYNPKADLYELALEEFHKELKNERLSRVNVLSRSWQPKKIA